MKRLGLVLGWAGLVILAAAQAPAPETTPVKIRGSRVNLRAKPALDAEPVGQVMAGALLAAKSFRDDWVEVVPPEQTALWVHRDFIKDQAVSAEKLYVRTGPSINHTVVATMLRGERLTVRGEFQDWVKIASPPSASFWVGRKLVEVLPVEKAPAPPPVPAPVNTAQAAVSNAPAVAPVETAPTNEYVPRDLNLVPLAGQGQATQREGVLRLVGFGFHQPRRYRLAKVVGRRVETICYVRGNSAQLNGLLDQYLKIRGREYWVSGSEYPVMVPDRIIPRASP
ncbi:MAG: SH3 domain-containing protein [Kiritimatiellaeota bacterium]|nr:SH3 domain-containing protein [Kiritimatiellota bacterium]